MVYSRGENISDGTDNTATELNNEIREVLRSYNSLLIHFNTPMSRHAVGYPDDLREAWQNPQWAMCYSTISASDRAPSYEKNPADAVACGSVGIIADICKHTNIIGVHPSDAGSNGRNHTKSLASPATAQSCRDSIISRSSGHNEWFLEKPSFIGIFTFAHPRVVVKPGGEIEYNISRVISDFPGQRIFSSSDDNFFEYMREKEAWEICEYNSIIPDIIN
ncbi:hypothetical protein ACE4RV_03610 [Acetobacter persici]|uniref:hypothetical protein n=1 Tax=Acetobacter persici TaxID=1076596 RepID=UPI0036DC5BBA